LGGVWGVGCEVGRKTGVWGGFGGSADFEGLAFKNLQIAFKWLFLFGATAFKSPANAAIFPGFQPWNSDVASELALKRPSLMQHIVYQ